MHNNWLHVRETSSSRKNPRHHQPHQCPSWRSSSWRVRDGLRRRETSDWSQCASGNPAGRWMMECWPPSAGRILRNMSIILNLNIWLPQSPRSGQMISCLCVQRVTGWQWLVTLRDQFVIIHDIDLSYFIPVSSLWCVSAWSELGRDGWTWQVPAWKPDK